MRDNTKQTTKVNTMTNTKENKPPRFRIQWRRDRDSVLDDTLTLLVNHPDNDDSFVIGFLHPNRDKEDFEGDGNWWLECLRDAGMTLWSELIDGDENDPGDNGGPDKNGTDAPLLSIINWLEASVDDDFIRRACLEWELCHAKAASEALNEKFESIKKERRKFSDRVNNLVYKASTLGNVPGAEV